MADTSSSQSPLAGVGVTALLVAAARAIETSRPDALARDEYAEHFVRAAPAGTGWPVRLDQVPARAADPLWGRLARFFGLRTRAFDDFLLRRATEGCRQVVLLGAGLDTRAHRLPWPRGCRVFEIDQPEVLLFKEAVLQKRGAVARAERITVATDLRRQWADALTAAGFDPACPTAWLAEGLLPYLPPAAEEELVRTVHAHSAPGSALAYEIKQGVDPVAARDYPIYAAARERIGLDLLAMFDGRPRPDSLGDLRGRGWSAEVCTPFDLTRRYGCGLEPEPRDAVAANRWIFSVLPASGHPGTLAGR